MQSGTSAYLRDACFPFWILNGHSACCQLRGDASFTEHTLCAPADSEQPKPHYGAGQIDRRPGIALQRRKRRVISRSCWQTEPCSAWCLRRIFFSRRWWRSWQERQVNRSSPKECCQRVSDTPVSRDSSGCGQACEEAPESRPRPARTPRCPASTRARSTPSRSSAQLLIMSSDKAFMTAADSFLPASSVPSLRVLPTQRLIPAACRRGKPQPWIRSL